MQIAIYGGSFNPPHVGHAMVAAWLGWTGQADEVWLLPTYAHPFSKSLLPWETRLRLCAALAETIGPHVKVCAIEGDLPVPSYTIDTLSALEALHPRHRFRLVIGADVLPETPRWKDWDLISASFAPIVVGRGGYLAVEGAPTFPTLSSTTIRQRLRDGLPVDGFVPEKVLAVLDDCSSSFSSP